MINLNGPEVKSVIPLMNTEEFLNIFDNVEDQELCILFLLLYLACYETGVATEMISRISRCFKLAFVRAFEGAKIAEPELLNRENAGLNVNFPNLSSLDSLSTQIAFCPLKFTSGMCSCNTLSLLNLFCYY
jgi:hypothetical protein